MEGKQGQNEYQKQKHKEKQNYPKLNWEMEDTQHKEKWFYKRQCIQKHRQNWIEDQELSNL